MKIISKATIEKHSQTVGERNEIDEHLAMILITERIFGQQILEPNWTWKRYFINQLFNVFLFLYIIIGTADVLKKVTNVELIVEAYYTLMAATALITKYLLFIGNRFKFRKLYVTTKTTFYDLIKDDSIQKSINVLNKLKTITRLLFSLVFFLVISYVTNGVSHYICGTRVTLSRTTSILMPMTSPYYELGSILHAVYVFEASFIILVIDMWFVILAFFYCETSDSIRNILEVEKRTTEESELSYARRLNDTLRRFFIAHEKQMTYLNMLSNYYKWPVVVPFCKVFVGTCLIMLTMSKNLNLTFTANMLPTFAEIFVYNWFGDRIKTKTENLKMALLNFDWLSMKIGDKSKYVIIICYMTKDFGIKTAFGNDLSLVTMTEVLKASYQAFAVLNTMQN